MIYGGDLGPWYQLDLQRGLRLKVSHVSSQPCLDDSTLIKTSGHQCSGEFPSLLISHVCCHTWLPREFSAVHGAKAKGQLESPWVGLSWLLPQACCPSADCNMYPFTVINCNLSIVILSASLLGPSRELLRLMVVLGSPELAVCVISQRNLGDFSKSSSWWPNCTWNRTWASYNGLGGPPCPTLFCTTPASLVTSNHVVPLFVFQIWLQHLCTHCFFYCITLAPNTPRVDSFIRISIKYVISSERPSLITHTKVVPFTHCPRQSSLFDMILFIYLTTCLWSVLPQRRPKPCLFCHCCVHVSRAAAGVYWAFI